MERSRLSTLTRITLRSAPLLVENGLAYNDWPSETILTQWSQQEMESEIVCVQEEKWMTIRRFADLGSQEEECLVAGRAANGAALAG
jgi:hypothetical protein